MNRRTALCAALLLTGAAVGAGCRRARPPAAPPHAPAVPSAALAQPVAALRGAQAAGLGRATEVKTYLPANMYEAIDGEADLFLSYDCRGLVVGKYDAGRALIAAEVFDQVEPINAFGVFSQLRGEGTPVAVGVEGVQLAGEAVLFWRSRFFVRVSAASADRPPLATLVGLSRSIAAGLGGPSSLPAWIAALPPGASREQYVARNVLGHGFLTHAMVGEYHVGAGTGRVVVARAADPAQARDWWARLRDVYHGSSEASASKTAAALPAETFRGTDWQGQQVRVARSGPYLVLVGGDCGEERVRQLLSATLSRLQPVRP